MSSARPDAGPPDAATTHSGASRPLTIAMMIESVIMGGAEMVVLRLAVELRSRGHTVHVVLPEGRHDWLTDRLKVHGFDWQTYDLRRPIDPGLPKRMAAMFDRLNVDVVHSHEFTTAVYGTAAARRLGLPHVITMHGNQKMMDSWRRRAALRWAFKRATHVVAVSGDTRRHLESTLGLKPGSVQAVPNGMPEVAGDRERLRTELGARPDEILLLTVGNLTERKGHVILLDALGRLEARGERFPWRLALAGGGPEQAKLEARIAELGFGDRVRLLGPRNDIADLQAAADVFVMPSLWEGLPLAIIEAMFGRNAIVASRTSGIPEAIDDGTHGLLVPPGDDAALADALGRVLSDPALRERLGSAAHARAQTDFTIGAMTDAYERLYG